jgi:hypothetical protein
MTTVDIILIVAAVFTGLLMTILAFFQRALKDLTAPEFALVMQRFLRLVRTHPLNYGLVTTSVLAAALVLLRRSPGVRSGSGGVGGLRRRSGHRIAVFRRADLRRLPQLEGRLAARGLARGARPQLPPQRGPGPRLGSRLRSFPRRPGRALAG